MPVKAVLLDLGGTLIEYYSRNEWPRILRECISGVADLLEDRGLNAGRDSLYDVTKLVSRIRLAQQVLQ